ncbi:hypothetical protein AQULUS_10130 [Aquicella lusitana]|uniref:Phosphoglycerol transferase n=1 Tax=Aquicella lusitana TaxID=254246 RepID=A0A370GZB5_9COXI|nr:phosphoglycerol transferase [Aquicella lusitana]VVC73278.1 hypothetical protein AQULUS_10130 [Aquicella lusitana]
MLFDGLIILLVSILFILLLMTTHAGLYPTVFADEWLYSSSARLQPLSTSITPSYLFLLLFKTTNYCGPDFLICARWINTCFFSLSSLFIYLISRQVISSRGTAILVALLSLAAPVNSYTAYFMPEALYFFSFWVWAWFVLSRLHQSAALLGSGSGFLLGIMALIKMHALFLIPAFILFLLLLSHFKSDQMNLRKAAWTICWMGMAFILIRASLGFILAGSAGLSLIGSKYQRNFYSLLNINHLSYLRLLSIPLAGHSAALALLFGVPLATMLNFRHKQKVTSQHSLQLLAIACLISLLFITAITTVEVTGWNPYDVIGRLHLRYYNFIFPLFVIIAFAETHSTSNTASFYWKLLVVSLLNLGILYGFFYLPTRYVISFIDCPELFGLLYNSTLFKWLCILALVSLWLWTVHQKYGAIFYVSIFLPIMLLTTNHYVRLELKEERLFHTDVYDRVGQFAHIWLNREAARLAVVGPELGGLFKALFYIDNPKTAVSELPLGTPLEFANIPADKTWVLMVGNYPLLGNYQVKFSMGDYTLVRLKTVMLSDLNKVPSAKRF